MNTKINILIAEPIAQRGIELLSRNDRFQVDVKLNLKPDELEKIIGDYDVLLVRSQTKVNAALLAKAGKLRAIGRAGVGVDNVDVEAATARGIIVMNTPAGNTISTCEHAFSMLLSLARNIPQAHSSMKAGKWERKSFEGVEVYSKTLGIVGMGRIGSEVARRAIAFGMRVLAYDPFLSLHRAKSLQVELVELDEIYARSDFITIHVPATDETRNMIGAEQFKKMKKGVRIVNCARGGIINEKELADAIRSGQVAGAALDVYEKEPPPADLPLRDLQQVVMTPHLGASTMEAQESVGVEIAEAVSELLLESTVRNAVNVPNVDAQTLKIIQPYLSFGQKLGRILSQLSPKRVEKLIIDYSGKISEVDTKPVSRAVLTGYLEHAAGKDVNAVNVMSIAENLGIQVEERKTSNVKDYTELIQIIVRSAEGEYSIAGTFYGSPNNPRIVRINDTPVEATPHGILFLMANKDRPGIVGHIGTIMGKHKVNIASMSLSREKLGGEALTVLNLDSVPSEACMAEIKRDPDIYWAKIAEL
ncbi:MAG: phosphoglycerate dehydrogenase [Verrucomicrobiae bacterium]|nr:phosphoglycerate dehydrogenase [Verrucomicrobiae bacterium]